MAINKVMIVVKLYNITILLCLASFVDSHKPWDTIIQTSIPKIAMMEIPNNRHTEKSRPIFHMVEKINPNAPVVKAIATILLKLAIIFSGLFAKVIPLTSRIIPRLREFDKYLK